MSNPQRVYFFPDDWHASPESTPDVGSVVTSIDSSWTTLIGPEQFQSRIIEQLYESGVYNIPHESRTFAAFLAAQPGAVNANNYQDDGLKQLVHSGYSIFSWQPTGEDLKKIAKDANVVTFASYLPSSTPKYVYVVTAVRVVRNLRINESGDRDNISTNQYKFGFRVKRLELKQKERKVVVKDKGDYTRGALYDDNPPALTTDEPDEYNIETTEDGWLVEIQGDIVETGSDGEKENWITLE
ncbi:hypothetical protein SBRCBS47491_009116 [Sporothrix bragantina]|uniref:Uncharacterized protein n=1 Tax=Sporothrix bragantina TaxID=671064 RepID=A0ABP0CSD2_9PEZI